MLMCDPLDSHLLVNTNASFRSCGCLFIGFECFISCCGMSLLLVCVSPSIPFMHSKGKSQIPAAEP